MEWKQAPPVVCSHRVRWESIASVSDGFLFASVALFPRGCFDKWKFAAEIWRPARQSIHVCIRTDVHVCEYISVNIKTEQIGNCGKHWHKLREHKQWKITFSFETNWSSWIKLIWSFFSVIWKEPIYVFQYEKCLEMYRHTWRKLSVSIPIHCNAFVQNCHDYTKLLIHLKMINDSFKNGTKQFKHKFNRIGVRSSLTHWSLTHWFSVPFGHHKM